ncbi:MAG: sulfotransferase family protein [Pseudomonadota bacterium]
MALEIIGPGFGRTGTNSLRLALTQLGFGPCHHMFEVRENHETQLPYWEAVVRGESVDWETVFRGYRAQVDWPGSRAWRALIAAYPKAKVILSTRSAESWYRSFSKTILPFIRDRDALDDPRYRGIAEMCAGLIDEGVFDGRMEDPAHAMAVFDAHEAAVKAAVPEDRLLVFDARQGWAPLCAFLGVAVPDEPYPMTNTSQDFQARTAAARGQA